MIIAIIIVNTRFELMICHRETMNPRDIMTDAIHNFHPQYQQYTQYSSTASTKVINDHREGKIVTHVIMLIREGIFMIIMHYKGGHSCHRDAKSGQHG